MSSPSQIAEPKARPVSGLPGSATPASRSGRPYKAYDQEYQFAERLSNPPPEFVIGSADIASSAAVQTDGPTENTADTGSPTGRASGSKESHRRESIWRPPPEKPWYKRIRRMWWIGVAITIVGGTAVILAILGAMGTFTGHGTADGTGTSSNETVTTTSCTAASCSTSTSAHPIPTGLPKECTDSSTFFQKVKWAGTTGPYDPSYDQVDSPEACCGRCYNSPGCGGWLYTGDKFTPCVKLIIGEDPKSVGKPDDKCPKGHCQSTTFDVADQHNGTGGLGPCCQDAKSS